MRALLIALSLLPLTTGADAQRAPSQSAPVQVASVPATAEMTLAFARAPRAEGAIVITIVRGDGPDLTQALAPNAPGWQGPLPADWVRITCLGERAVCLSIDRGATDEALVRLTAYPRATLTATWPATVAGQAVRVMVSRQTEAGDSAFGPTRGQWSVPTRADGRFSLDVPQGTLDIRLVASGCAAVYRFDVKAGATTALGPLPCVPGGSIAARVRDSQSGNPVSSCLATVRPSGPRVETDSTQRVAQLVAQSVTCNAFGFFQTAGLAPGRYAIATDSRAHAPDTADVEVVADTETSVDLWLTPFRSLTVRVSPPVAPDGRPWTVELRTSDSVADPSRDSVRATVPLGGEVRFSRVLPQEHDIEILTQDEQLMTAMTTRLPDEDVPLEIAIPLVRIIGRVTLARQPVAAARVTLMNSNTQQAFTTDDDGQFTGWMRQPSAEEEEWISTAVILPGESTKITSSVVPRLSDAHTVEIELALGSSKVVAEVIDSDERRVSGVTVHLVPRGTASASGNRRSSPGDTKTDASGTATISGVSPGRYLAYGYHPTGNIKTTEFDVPPDGDVTIRLYLAGKREHRFEFVSAHGTPLAGATVGIKSDSAMISYFRPLDGLGQASLHVAEGSKRSAITVWADSQMLWGGCVETGEGDRTRVTLPPPSTGTLRITRPLQIQLGRESPLLISDQGAVYLLSDLFLWRRTTVEERESEDVLEVSGLAAGRYRAVLYQGFFLDTGPIVQAACAGAISFDDPSAGTLTPGGVLELKWPTPK